MDISSLCINIHVWLLSNFCRLIHNPTAVCYQNLSCYTFVMSSPLLSLKGLSHHNQALIISFNKTNLSYLTLASSNNARKQIATQIVKLGVTLAITQVICLWSSHVGNPMSFLKWYLNITAMGWSTEQYQYGCIQPWHKHPCLYHISVNSNIISFV